MASVDKEYNRMLTQFMTAQFRDFMTRKTERDGLKLQLVNPAYSSVGGFVKYGYKNKLQVDVAASLWIARQAHFGGEYFKVGHVSRAKTTAEKIVPHASFQQSKKRSHTWHDISNSVGKSRALWPSKVSKLFEANKTPSGRMLQTNTGQQPTCLKTSQIVLI